MLGLALRLGGKAGWRDVGGAVMVLGGSGLAWWFWQAYQVWKEAQRAEEARKRRMALRAARRERTWKERARRQAERATQKETAARQAEVRAREQEVQRLQAQQESARRSTREIEIAGEVRRLRALSDAELIREVIALFARRGWHVEQPDTEAACDLILKDAAGNIMEAVRCAPSGRMATVVDVRALEAWRQDIGAARASLVALAGFAPAAVALVRALPITLVEAYLLAHWRCNPEKVQ